MIFDTHTHLYLEEFAGGEAAAVERAIASGVGQMMFPNVNRDTVAPMRSLHSQFPDATFMAIGLHPEDVNGESVDWQIDFVLDNLADTSVKFHAIGEIGVDLYWDKTFADKQMQVFERQMQLAVERNLPAIIHCREALNEILEVIDGLEQVPQAVFHSFGGTTADVEAVRRRGDFYFGINGIVTFKNSKVRETLPAIGVQRILLETDSPYLAPVPFRGRRNESAYIIHTAAYVADQLGLPVAEVAEVTTRSGRELFRC